ncbi:hypothetical protein SO802_009313 [Lithocarpus litseifolius]|uniref:Uncharacterized protein n=1 Tax=Lithocarpus litseifolius TaxID=425828 RepID=A0AAW2DBP2_9ROSI
MGERDLKAICTVFGDEDPEVETETEDEEEESPVGGFGNRSLKGEEGEEGADEDEEHGEGFRWLNVSVNASGEAVIIEVLLQNKDDEVRWESDTYTYNDVQYAIDTIPFEQIGVGSRSLNGHNPMCDDTCTAGTQQDLTMEVCELVRIKFGLNLIKSDWWVGTALEFWVRGYGGAFGRAQWCGRGSQVRFRALQMVWPWGFSGGEVHARDGDGVDGVIRRLGFDYEVEYCSEEGDEGEEESEDSKGLAEGVTARPAASFGFVSEGLVAISVFRQRNMVDLVLRDVDHVGTR